MPCKLRRKNRYWWLLFNWSLIAIHENVHSFHLNDQFIQNSLRPVYYKPILPGMGNWNNVLVVFLLSIHLSGTYLTWLCVCTLILCAISEYSLHISTKARSHYSQQILRVKYRQKLCAPQIIHICHRRAVTLSLNHPCYLDEIGPQDTRASRGVEIYPLCH